MKCATCRLQPCGLQPYSLQPATLQPAASLLAALQPCSLQPCSLALPNLTPAILQICSLQPCSCSLRLLRPGSAALAGGRNQRCGPARGSEGGPGGPIWAPPGPPRPQKFRNPVCNCQWPEQAQVRASLDERTPRPDQSCGGRPFITHHVWSSLSKHTPQALRNPPNHLPNHPKPTPRTILGRFGEGFGMVLLRFCTF